MKISDFVQLMGYSSLALVLSACGGGGSDSSGGSGGDSSEESSSLRTVTANVIKGPVTGAECELYSVDDSGEQGDLLGSATSLDGVVNFTDISYTGATLTSCTGGTYTDEATGETKTAPRMRTVVEVGTDTQITITPLTEIAVASASNYNSVDNAATASAFGLDGIEIATTRPTDLNTETPANDGPGAYGLAMAIVSQYQSDSGLELANVMESLAEDLEDGSLSGPRQDEIIDAVSNLADSPVGAVIDTDTSGELIDNIIDATSTTLVADAGSDFTAPTGSRVELDGSASSGGSSYTWAITEQPQGSSTTLVDSTGVSAAFVPDVDGSYTLTLTVSDDSSGSSNDTVTVTASTKTWLINNNDAAAYIDALTNVQFVTTYQIGPNNFWQITASGIPDYTVTMTQAHIDALNNRPEAATDFDNGQTSAQVGDVIEFGQDIGYNITQIGCELGYWPPGPACPSDQQRVARIPETPAPASAGEECETSINTMGLMLNGTSIYNWSDGVSYNNAGTWNQLAPEFEIYDVDICSGHAQTQGDYHHHMFSSCLAELFGDEGQAHSPIYGYAADGYPVYGPYYAKDTLAKSAWVKRDYSDTTKGGCGDGARSCLLVSQYDLSQGTTPTASAGPDTDEVVTSNSGNEFVVESGYYFEDYYYDADLTALGGEYLDEHNGHDHDDLGYHYHTTAVQGDDGSLAAVFPYNIGPTFYGEAPGGSLYTCTQLP